MLIFVLLQVYSGRLSQDFCFTFGSSQIVAGGGPRGIVMTVFFWCTRGTYISPLLPRLQKFTRSGRGRLLIPGRGGQCQDTPIFEGNLQQPQYLAQTLLRQHCWHLPFMLETSTLLHQTLCLDFKASKMFLHALHRAYCFAQSLSSNFHNCTSLHNCTFHNCYIIPIPISDFCYSLPNFNIIQEPVQVLPSP